MTAAVKVGRLRPGELIGKYEIVRFLAAGGMGELYLGRARGVAGFQKTVALKRVIARAADDADLVAMFLDEARVSASLQHPNIVQVFDVGEHDGGHFFAMEYVPGTDLRSLLAAAHRRGEQVPLAAVLSITIDVCAGLHHAHEAKDESGRSYQIVHRDVSPSNVLVSSGGHAKVADFGVAKATSRSAETRTGQVKGKISYMSPEQLRGEELDRRSDVFAIGVLLWEATIGERLFQRDSDFLSMDAIVNDDAPRPSTKRADYPPELEVIVMKALARDRRVRYASAYDLRRDLDAFAREARIPASPLEVEHALRTLMPESPSDAAPSEPTESTSIEHSPSVREEVSVSGPSERYRGPRAEPIMDPTPRPPSSSSAIAPIRPPAARLRAAGALVLAVLAGAAIALIATSEGEGEQESGRRDSGSSAVDPPSTPRAPERAAPVVTPPAQESPPAAPIATQTEQEAPPAAPTKQDMRVRMRPRPARVASRTTESVAAQGTESAMQLVTEASMDATPLRPEWRPDSPFLPGARP